MANKDELLKRMALNAWNAQLSRMSKLFESLTDEQLKQTIGINRNSGIYLLGHLTTTNDAIFPILGLGDKLYPELYETFVQNPDNASLKEMSIPELRIKWNEVNRLLTIKLDELPGEHLFTKHEAVSAEDFAKEPHRNKLNVLLSRASHLAYHLGQLTLLKPKN